MARIMVRLAPIPDGARSRHTSKSLEQGLRVLELFTGGEPEWGVAEIAEQLEMPRSTAHRYLTSLVGLGQLERAEHRKYRLIRAVSGA